MKKVFAIVTLTGLSVYAGLASAEGSFEEKKTHSYSVALQAPMQIDEVIAPVAAPIDMVSGQETEIVAGQITSNRGKAYLSAPASAAKSFNSADKSWMVGQVMLGGKEINGLKVKFTGVGEASNARVINAGIPSYPVNEDTGQFKIVAVPGESTTVGSYTVAFDSAIWVE